MQHEPLEQPAQRLDHHSLGNPHQIRVTHVKLNLVVDFDNEQLHGTATLRVKRQLGCPAGAPLILDTKNLTIQSVWTRRKYSRKRLANFTLGQTDAILGTPLVVPMVEGSDEVIIAYQTTAGADALQWMPAAENKPKSLFTQGEAILTRTWVPLQDSPSVRITYEAQVTTPSGVIALMSAQHRPSSNKNVFRFKMPYCIPPYLMSLAVGNFAFRKLGRRTGVYADPSIVDSAAWEFAQAEEMIEAAEKLYGPYRWGRWDILVLPASFPFGGMENPLLTFVTPTLIAGDRSLVNVIAHELAHSWSGNLVTNATWSDFWLNEGFTRYVEDRLQEALFGVERAHMETALGVESLLELMQRLPASDQILHINLEGRDADDGCTLVPYEKGSMFLRTLENAVGRKKLDIFIHQYFDHFAFQSITTAQFEEYLQEHLLKLNPQAAAQVNVHAWIHDPGLGQPHLEVKSSQLEAVETEAKIWDNREKPLTAINTQQWSTHEWLRFLRSMPTLQQERMAELDATFHFTEQTNAEILFQWLVMSVRSDYEPAFDRLKSFLGSVGRRKFIAPLYRELTKAPNGMARAQELFKQSRGVYHSTLIQSVQKLLANPSAPTTD